MFPKAVTARMGRATVVVVCGSGVALALGGVATPVAQAEPPGMCIPGMPCGPGGPGGPGGFGMGGPGGPGGYGMGGPGGPGGAGPMGFMGGPGGPGLGGPRLGPIPCLLPIVCPPPR